MKNTIFKVSVLFVMLLTAMPVAAATFSFGNSEYWVVYDKSISWDSAKAAAEASGGHLATITSADERNFIQSTVLNGAKGELWLGGFQSSDPGLSAPKDNWNWVTGEEWNYSDWYATEANNYAGRDEKYLGIRQSQQWQWNDEASLGNINGYIVEKSLNTAPTPIPAGVWILGAGLAALAGLKRRFSRS
ncbi:lectin-like protein [Maridesulfovibrio sp. FT414]|uniref:lectin-like protein n=1 Tax=Maridesulfovibrio sp. FT414 TaxID=2979469 RepID=UPI003D8053AA